MFDFKNLDLIDIASNAVTMYGVSLLMGSGGVLLTVMGYDIDSIYVNIAISIISKLLLENLLINGMINKRTIKKLNNEWYNLMNPVLYGGLAVGLSYLLIDQYKKYGVQDLLMTFLVFSGSEYLSEFFEDYLLDFVGY